MTRNIRMPRIFTAGFHRRESRGHEAADTNASRQFMNKVLRIRGPRKRCLGTVFVLIVAGILSGFPTYAQARTTPEEGDSGVAEASRDSTDENKDAAAARAEEGEPASPDGADDDEADDTLSGSVDDSSGSIEVALEKKAYGWDFRGDMRAGYVSVDTDRRDGSDDSSSEWLGRFRIGGNYNIADKFVVGGRIASICSTNDCNPALEFDSTLPSTSTVDQGVITFDQLYVHSFRRERFDLAIGRLQTKFVARAGVFAKSLDRNDSHNFNVNWTDGLHGTLHLKKDSVVHVIFQNNAADGTSSVRRGPIDFADDDSRITYFLAWESLQRQGPFHQLGFDITLMPRSLLKDGSRSGRIEDYLGLVARFATSWLEETSGPRLNVAGEVGYAPETPTRAAMGLPGNGDTDGLAWNLAASVMDIRPNHNIGINYGRTDAGWLLSPQYRENEELIEIRYLWRRSRRQALDIRARWRNELQQLDGTTRKQEELDFYVRLTLGFNL